MIQVSLKLSALLGQRVIITVDHEGYPAGSIAVVDEFVITAKGAFFRIQYEGIPCSLEEFEPLVFSQVAYLLLPNGYKKPLRSFFKQGFPSCESKFNLMMD